MSVSQAALITSKRYSRFRVFFQEPGKNGRDETIGLHRTRVRRDTAHGQLRQVVSLAMLTSLNTGARLEIRAAHTPFEPLVLPKYEMGWLLQAYLL